MLADSQLAMARTARPIRKYSAARMSDGSNVSKHAERCLGKLHRGQKVEQKDLKRVKKVTEVKALNCLLKGIYGSIEYASQEDGYNKMDPKRPMTYFGIGSGNGSQEGKTGGIWRRVVRNHLVSVTRHLRSGLC